MDINLAEHAKRILSTIDPSALSVARKLRLAQLLIDLHKNLPTDTPSTKGGHSTPAGNSLEAWLLDAKATGYLGEHEIRLGIPMTMARADLYKAYLLYCRGVEVMGMTPSVFGRHLLRQEEHVHVTRRRSAETGRYWEHTLLFSTSDKH